MINRPQPDGIPASSQDSPATSLYTGPDSPQPFPLLVSDPPRIGDFWLDARLTARQCGIVYFAHAYDQPAVLLLVLSDGAAKDASARDRLAGEVNKLHIDTVVARGGQGQNTGRLAGKFRGEDDDPVPASAQPIAPWVALAFDGRPHALAEADRLLRAVDLSSTPSLGAPSGPDYKLHWLDNSHAGHWRVWPLAWPGRHDRAGWVPLGVAWLLTILLGALALLIAVLLFQNTPPSSAKPPVQTNQSQSQQSQSPQSSNPSQSQSQSQSASQSQSQSQSASQSQSQSQSRSASQSSSSGSPSSMSASPSNSSGSASGSQSPQSSSPGRGSPSRQPSMGSAGTGSATATNPPPTRNTRL